MSKNKNDRLGSIFDGRRSNFCAFSNNLELSSTCLGSSAQPTAMGEYSPICSNTDGSNVYMHVNPISNIYIYHDNITSVSIIRNYYHIFIIFLF